MIVEIPRRIFRPGAAVNGIKRRFSKAAVPADQRGCESPLAATARKRIAGPFLDSCCRPTEGVKSMDSPTRGNIESACNLKQ